MKIFSLACFLLLPSMASSTGYLEDKQILQAAKSHEIHDVYRLLNLTYGWPLRLDGVGYWNVDSQQWSLALTAFLKQRQQEKTRRQLQRLIERLRQAGVKVT